MPRFCANLTMMYNEVGFLDRFAAAARSGFKGVEYLVPYDYDKGLLAEILDRNQLSQVAFCLPMGDFAGGEVGIACLPDRVGEFQDGVGLGVEYARALECDQLVCISGIAPPDGDPELLHDTFASNLGFATSELRRYGIRLLIEPINTIDRPGIFLQTMAQAASIIREVGSDNLFVEYDTCHAQSMQGDLARTIEANLNLIGHIQIADVPGRHEPGTGEINFPFLLSFLDRIGYGGWVGCEYRPRTTTEESLGWIRPYL